jgi:preprotein translocase subunit SecY
MKTILSAFRNSELRNRILFTVAVLAVYRIGSLLPSPMVNYDNIQKCVNQGQHSSNALVGLADLFSGGAVLQLSFFALGIMPFFSAAIITQLLGAILPKFIELRKQGPAGHKMIARYTRFITAGIAVAQAIALVQGTLKNNALGCDLPVLYDSSLFGAAVLVLALTVGALLVMWLGEKITERGIGTGASLIMFTAVFTRLPGSLDSIFLTNGTSTFLAVLGVIAVTTVLVVIIERMQTRIPVQYATNLVRLKRQRPNTSYIPLKVNMAGIMPVIFASAVLNLPVSLAQSISPDTNGRRAAWVEWISDNLTKGDHPVYLLSYFLIVVGFSYLYVKMTFNVADVTDALAQNGGYISNVRAGEPTTDYLTNALRRTTLPGAVYLGAIALLPMLAFSLLGVTNNFTFGGTSILIIVGVTMDTLNQIKVKARQDNYGDLLN